MPKANAKTDATLSVPQPAGKATRKSSRKGTSKGDADVAQSNTTVDIDPQVLPQESSSRPKRLAANKGSKDNHPGGEAQSVPTSRKRQAQANDQASNIPATNTPETGLEQPPTKKPKTKSVKDSGIDPTPAPAASIKKGGTKKPKKAASADSGQPEKENIPPIPVATASKSKKSNTTDRREQQLNAVDHEGKQKMSEISLVLIFNLCSVSLQFSSNVSRSSKASIRSDS